MAVRDIEIQEQFISAETLWDMSKLPKYADKIFELSEGVIVEVSRPGALHGETAVRIASKMFTFVEAHNLGYVTTESGYILGKAPDGRDTVRGPDVAFVSIESAPDGLPHGYVPFAPDLAVEVVSPNDLANTIERKVRDLLNGGSRLVWVFYTDTRSVVERRPGGKSAVYDEGDTLDGQDVLPGFKLPVASVFPARMPEPEFTDDGNEHEG